MDCRGCYTAMATLHMLGLDSSSVVQRSGLVSFVQRCQVRSGCQAAYAVCTTRMSCCSALCAYLRHSSWEVTMQLRLLKQASMVKY